MIGIYKIINLNNNKVYIGRSNNIERRWKDHLRYSNNPSSREYHSPLHRAIRKYGIDSFKLEILEETLLEDLNSKEQYWIEHFQSHLSDKGYNLTLGGQGKLGKGKLINQYDLNGAFIKTWEGPTASLSYLGKRIKLNKPVYGFYWKGE